MVLVSSAVYCSPCACVCVFELRLTFVLYSDCVVNFRFTDSMPVTATSAQYLVWPDSTLTPCADDCYVLCVRVNVLHNIDKHVCLTDAATTASAAAVLLAGV